MPPRADFLITQKLFKVKFCMVKFLMFSNNQKHHGQIVALHLYAETELNEMCKPTVCGSMFFNCFFVV